MTTQTIERDAVTQVERFHHMRADEADAGIRGIVTGVAVGTFVLLAVGALFFQ